MRIFASLALSFACAALISVPSYADEQKPGEDPVLAVVNGTDIHRSEVVESARSLPPEYQAQIEQILPALVERYVWPGRDGVPGNGHLADKGTWDRLAQQRATISTANGATDTLFQLPGSPPLFRDGSQVRLQLDANADHVGTYPEFDGPQQVGTNRYAKAALGNVVWSKSSLEDAYNPPQAAIKYRVVYFKYLDQ